MTAAGHVAQLLRYPVKSMLGEQLADVAVTARGLHGDRSWAVLDETGAVGSAKHPRKWGGLLTCRSSAGEDGTVLVELPDGVVLPAGDPDLGARLSKLLGRPVLMSDVPPQEGLLERAVPEYEGGTSEKLRSTATTDATGTSVTAGKVKEGTFFDFGPIHLVTTASLAGLRAAHPGGDVDAVRFRPNIVVDWPSGPGFPEDDWTDRRVRIGDALFQVVMPTPRCVVPTLAHGSLPADTALMHAAARHHRIPVPDRGSLTCLGTYLDVLEPGCVALGDPVLPLDVP